ncbi:UNVERIFIED_CONTAM: hypothetical protein Sindi_0057700, partial [Sesamum indicum]
MTGDGDDSGGDGGEEECGHEVDLAYQTTEDGCTLNMMVERLKKMAIGDFSTITGGDLRRRPTLGFTSTKSSGAHGEHDSISFNIPNFSKLAHTVKDASDKQALDALRELNNKLTERFGKKATARCFPPSRKAITMLFLPRVLRRPVRNTRAPVRRVEKTKTPDLKPLEPAVDWSQQPSMDAGQIVAEFVSTAGYVASENRTEEMAEDGALDLVKIAWSITTWKILTRSTWMKWNKTWSIMTWSM